MVVNPDFKDLLSALNDAGARSLVVGGYALAFHGAPRFTKDLDLWVDSTLDNAKRVHGALLVFGAPLGDLTPEELAAPNIVVQIGMPPNRVDIITGIDGVGFEEAWKARVPFAYGGVNAYVIGKADLIRNKRATGREQDRLDADTLEKI
jgi:hypothetical protein